MLRIDGSGTRESMTVIPFKVVLGVLLLHLGSESKVLVEPLQPGEAGV